MTHAPLIFALRLDQESSNYFNNLRVKHFPPEKNFIEAHLTLFHKLPAQREDLLQSSRQVITETPEFPLYVQPPYSIGRGVAFRIEAAPLDDLRRSLRTIWDSELSPQDRQGFRAHITIQNKVSSSEAKALLEDLGKDFRRFECRALSVDVYYYEGGPWRLKESILLASG